MRQRSVKCSAWHSAVSQWKMSMLEKDKSFHHEGGNWFSFLDLMRSRRHGKSWNVPANEKRANGEEENEVASAEACYEITGRWGEVMATGARKERERERKKRSTWPKGSWALRGEVEALRTEEGEVVGGAGGCWEETTKRKEGGNKAGKRFWRSLHAEQEAEKQSVFFFFQKRRACALSLKERVLFSEFLNVIILLSSFDTLMVWLKTTICSF